MEYSQNFTISEQDRFIYHFSQGTWFQEIYVRTDIIISTPHCTIFRLHYTAFLFLAITTLLFLNNT